MRVLFNKLVDLWIDFVLEPRDHLVHGLRLIAERGEDALQHLQVLAARLEARWSLLNVVVRHCLVVVALLCQPSATFE